MDFRDDDVMNDGLAGHLEQRTRNCLEKSVLPVDNEGQKRSVTSSFRFLSFFLSFPAPHCVKHWLSFKLAREFAYDNFGIFLLSSMRMFSVV